MAILDGVRTRIRAGFAVIVPAGTSHNIINTGSASAEALYALRAAEPSGWRASTTLVLTPRRTTSTSTARRRPKAPRWRLVSETDHPPTRTRNASAEDAVVVVYAEGYIRGPRVSAPSGTRARRRSLPARTRSGSRSAPRRRRRTSSRPARPARRPSPAPSGRPRGSPRSSSRPASHCTTLPRSPPCGGPHRVTPRSRRRDLPPPRCERRTGSPASSDHSCSGRSRSPRPTDRSAHRRIRAPPSPTPLPSAGGIRWR